MNVLFIVQRYGIEVDGGAELYCRWLAERFGQTQRVTVLTTTARDYVTWNNHYSPGISTLNGVQVIRMPVETPRNIDTFNQLTNTLLSGPTDKSAEEDWIRAQGPWSPKLLEYLESNHNRYDVLIFVTYLYAPSVLGIRIAPEKSILIPTAHNEPVAAMSIFKEMYRQVAGLLYLTEPEKVFVESTYAVQNKPGILLGTGIELPPSREESGDIISKYQLKGTLLLYMGRIEVGKGCDTMIRYLQAYRKQRDGDVVLVLAGRLHMKLPDDPAIRYLGFIPDEEIKPIIDASDVIIVPSPYESLSILLLQAFAQSKPVIANALSPVLLAHCQNSNGGLFFANEDEFIEALDLLLKSSALRRRLGENGSRYIEERFAWSEVMTRLTRFCLRIASNQNMVK